MTEEVRKCVEVLRYCEESGACCGGCPSGKNEQGIPNCYSQSHIADLIESLSAQLEQVTREQDAAVEDIQKATIYLCQVCKKYHPAQKDVHPHYCEELGSHPDYGGAIACSMFEWRGIQEEV